MQTYVDGILMAHAWLSGLSSDVFGIAFPLALFLAAPFLAPLLFALSLRRVVSALGIGCAAWLGGSVLAQNGFSAITLAQFVVAMGIAIGFCVEALARRRSLDRSRGELDEAEAILTDAMYELDRERFWRRASGDARAAIGDEDISSLIERVENHKKTSADVVGKSQAA